MGSSAQQILCETVLQIGPKIWKDIQILAMFEQHWSKDMTSNRDGRQISILAVNVEPLRPWPIKTRVDNVSVTICFLSFPCLWFFDNQPPSPDCGNKTWPNCLSITKFPRSRTPKSVFPYRYIFAEKSGKDLQKYASRKKVQILKRLRFHVGFCRAWHAWMASHAWEGIGLMDYGQLSLQRVIARQRVRGWEEQRGAVASLNCSSAALPVSWREIDVSEGGGGEERSGG